MISDVYFPRINGVSTSIKTFRTELHALGVESTLIAPDYDKQDKLVYDVDDEIVRIPSRQVMFDPEDRILRKKFLGELKGLLASKKYDLVHIQTPFIAHYMGMALAKHMGVPVVETYHTFFEEYFYHYIPFLPKACLRFAARWFSRTQCNRLDALVVPSTAMNTKLQDYGIRTEMAIIPTGVTIPEREENSGQAFREKYGVPSNRPVLLHVGRVAFEKNIAFLLDVFCEVQKKLPEAVLVIAGEGPAKKSLQKKAVQLGIDDSVYFVGYLDRDTELHQCYAAGDVFVFASRTETQGLVLLEAMAMGLTVVSTAEMGTWDILMAEKGAVIATEDTTDFSSTLVSLLNDKARLKKMSAEAVVYAGQWSPTAMAEKCMVFIINIPSQAVQLRVKPSRQLTGWRQTRFDSPITVDVTKLSSNVKNSSTCLT